jgi:hypothetical protein
MKCTGFFITKLCFLGELGQKGTCIKLAEPAAVTIKNILACLYRVIQDESTSFMDTLNYYGYTGLINMA